MDLTAVEGLSDLIRAETEAQRKQALGQADGALKQLYEGWARRLTHARAMIEAELDFSDEEDIPGSVTDRIWPDMQNLSLELSEHLSRAKTAEIVRDGFRIALVGAPNAGKSSLLNNLARRDVAIVSDIAGTTRDVVEVRLDIDGHLVLLQDTAGLRDADNEIEVEGMRRSLIAAENADLVLILRDIRVPPETLDQVTLKNVTSIDVWTKSDLIGNDEAPVAQGDIVISNKSGTGIDTLIAEIERRIAGFNPPSGEVLPTRERHTRLLTECQTELNSALEQTALPIEVRSELLRNAAVSLGRITGTVDVEDLLGVIFSEFCVGK